MDIVNLTISDNGPGLPADFAIENATGFGLMIVRLLCEQLNADFSLIRESKMGVKWIIRFEIK